jgi:hypothetical protein
MINVGDVDGAADDLITLRHGGAVVVPVPHRVAMAPDPPPPLLL